METHESEGLFQRISRIKEVHSAMFGGVTASNSSCNTVPESQDELAVDDAECTGSDDGLLAAESAPPKAPVRHASPLVSDADIAAATDDGGGIPAPRHETKVDISRSGALRHTVTARLTDEDYRLLCDGARESKLDRSGYLRQLIRIRWILGDVGNRIVIVDRMAVMAIARELTRWGYHYNQAVHALNSIALRMKPGRGVDQQWLESETERIELALNQVQDMREDILGSLGELCNLPTIRGN